LVSFIQIDGRILKGIFQERLNRFLTLVKIEKGIRSSFLPNPGRMYELLTPGTPVVLREVFKEGRKTKYDLIGVYHNDQIVSIDSRVPNKLVRKALINRDIEELSEYDTIQPEYSHGHSRFDFFLANEREKCFLEVKSCTLVKDGVALFPDAPTEKGRRHVQTLMEAVKSGYRACVLFIIQRTDAQVFTPNIETDPAFGTALRNAFSARVEIFAYYSEFLGTTITLKGKVKVELESHRDN